MSPTVSITSHTMHGSWMVMDAARPFRGCVVCCRNVDRSGAARDRCVLFLIIIIFSPGPANNQASTQTLPPTCRRDRDALLDRRPPLQQKEKGRHGFTITHPPLIRSLRSRGNRPRLLNKQKARLVEKKKVGGGGWGREHHPPSEDQRGKME